MKKEAAKEKSDDKKGQVNLSFGMIFSIFLIIVFIIFAYFAIGKFLDIQKSAKTGQFKTNLQSDIDQMWRSSSGSQQVEYSLPSSIEFACLVDFSSEKSGAREDLYEDLRFGYSQNENLIFYPVGSSGAVTSIVVKNIDIYSITAGENPYCIENINGKIKLTIKKDSNAALVTVTK